MSHPLNHSKISNNIQKYIAFALLFFFVVLGVLSWLMTADFDGNAHLIRRTQINRKLFVFSIQEFFKHKQKFPESALELHLFMNELEEKTGNKKNNYLKRIIVSDLSIFQRYIGKYFNWDQQMTGYGKSYDDLDKYLLNLRVEAPKHPDSSQPLRQVHIDGCHNKLLYYYDKQKNLFILLACQGNQMDRHIASLQKNQLQRISENTVDWAENTSKYIDLCYINKKTKQIYPSQFFVSERHSSRIKQADTTDWVEVAM